MQNDGDGDDDNAYRHDHDHHEHYHPTEEAMIVTAGFVKITLLWTALVSFISSLH